MKFFAAAILLIGIVFQAQGPSTSDQVALAEAAYARGDYAAAIQLYDGLIQLGYRDGALYFDLASAYYQLGDSGRALVSYLRAQEWIPRDGALNDAISLVRASRIDIEPDDAGLGASLANLTIPILTMTELTEILWLIAVVEAGLIACQIIWARLRSRLRAASIVGGVIFVLGVILLGGRLIWTEARPPAVVVEDKVSAMSGPGDSYMALFDLHAAAETRIVQMQGDWVWVELADGRQCWIPVQAIERVDG